LITVEKIQSAELLADLHSMSFVKGWSLQACHDVLTMPGTRCWIARCRITPAGFLVIRQAADEGEVITTGVTPDFRRKGLAVRLFETASADLEGCDRLFLEVSTANTAAASLYRRLGFRETGRRPRYYADGSDALVMVR
jgi:ribosomal-protein-alanine N-acetyltransferase